MAFLPKKSYRFLSADRDAPNSSSVVVVPEPLFEFDESDLWANSNSISPAQEVKSSIPAFRFSKKPTKKLDRDRDGVAKSLPVNIPDWSKMRYSVKESDDEDEESDAKVPPHEYLLARQTRNCEMGSFSVHEGRGRTLKGRDLSRVRNAIFEKTGFED